MGNIFKDIAQGGFDLGGQILNTIPGIIQEVGPGIITGFLEEDDVNKPVIVAPTTGMGPIPGMDQAAKIIAAATGGTVKKKTRKANPMNATANKAAMKRLSAASCHAQKMLDDLSCICSTPAGRTASGAVKAKTRTVTKKRR